MSTLSIAPAFVPAFDTASFEARVAPTRRATRLTRRGRVALVVGFLGLALALMTVFGGWAAATHGSGNPEPVRVVTVQPGDTLYDIAGEVAAPGHVRAMVLHIQDLNSLDGATLEVGQQLAIPRS